MALSMFRRYSVSNCDWTSARFALQPVAADRPKVSSPCFELPRQRSVPKPTRLLLVAVFCVVWTGFGWAGLGLGFQNASADSGKTRLPALVPPVPGGIVDNWRPPSSPYGPGNQGVDLRALSGEPVLSVGDGVVTFAGQVGGRLFVVIDVGGGLRVTLGFLASIRVRTGQSVRNRDLVAYAKGPVHVGARLGTTYIDPRPLFGKKSVRLTR